jgi:hypothetical protein
MHVVWLIIGYMVYRYSLYSVPNLLSYVLASRDNFCQESEDSPLPCWEGPRPDLDWIAFRLVERYQQPGLAVPHKDDDRRAGPLRWRIP